MMRYFFVLLAMLTTLKSFAAPSTQGHGVILLYHHVAADTPPSTSISPEKFKEHLEFLRDNNYSVIALDKMIKNIREGTDLPDKSVAITFDDGYSSIYETAFPLLKSFGFPFTLFLSTGPIDREQQNYMTWKQVREMSDAGVIIANHMVEHPYMLEKQPQESHNDWLNRLETELLIAETRIKEETGKSHRFLAYPYGEFDTPIKTVLEENNFIGFAQNSGAIGHNSDFLALPRFPLASIYANLETAKIKLASKSFDVQLIEPGSPVTAVRDPTTTLQFNPKKHNLSQIGCFANSQPLPMNWIDKTDGIVRLEPTQIYEGRRWRYICTAPVPGEDRFYWYSVQWIKID